MVYITLLGDASTSGGLALEQVECPAEFISMVLRGEEYE